MAGKPLLQRSRLPNHIPVVGGHLVVVAGLETSRQHHLLWWPSTGVGLGFVGLVDQALPSHHGYVEEVTRDVAFYFFFAFSPFLGLF